MKSDTTVIYSDEHLTLTADLATSHLIVHTDGRTIRWRRP